MFQLNQIRNGEQFESRIPQKHVTHSVWRDILMQLYPYFKKEDTALNFSFPQHLYCHSDFDSLLTSRDWSTLSVQKNKVGI